MTMEKIEPSQATPQPASRDKASRGKFGLCHLWLATLFLYFCLMPLCMHGHHCYAVQIALLQPSAHRARGSEHRPGQNVHLLVHKASQSWLAGLISTFPATAELYGGQLQAREGGVVTAVLLWENGDWYSGEVSLYWCKHLHAMTNQLAIVLINDPNQIVWGQALWVCCNINHLNAARRSIAR